MQDALKVFETGAARFQPDPVFSYSDDPQYVLDQQFLAWLVGSVALGLPVAMLFGAVLGSCFYDSVSHFYYAQFLGDVLVAALVFIGTFLVAYRGECRPESVLATIAGLCAFGVAVFPASGRGCEAGEFSGRALVDLTAPSLLQPATVSPAEHLGQFFQLFPYVQVLHFTAAALLFAFLAYYAFCVFTRVIESQHRAADGRLTHAKQARNRFYIASGAVIVACMLAIAANAVIPRIIGVPWDGWDAYNATFWFEAMALWAFGVSWMVKGRFFGLLLLDERDRPRDRDKLM